MNKMLPKEKNRAVSRYLRWGILLITLLTLFFLRGNKIVGAYYLNRGTQALLAEDTQNVVSNLKTALRYQPDNALANRRLAQAYLELDQPEQALQAVRQALALSPDDASIQLLLGDVYDRLGNPEQVIFYYEASATEDRQTQLAVNYLQLADQLWTEGKREEAVTIWRDKARDNEYSGLYANWRLVRYYTGDEESTTPYREAARYFPLESVAPPPDPRLAAYQTQSILGVVADKIWTRETLLNVVSYRVWQDQSESTADILQRLLVNNSDDTDIHFYLGELYHRRGDWEQAEAEYGQVLSIDPQYAQAYLRLGMVAESSSSQAQVLNEAANWYQQYHQLAPDDILGLKRLVEICTRLEQTGNAGVNCRNIATLQEEYKNKTDDRRIVAEMLDVPVEDVTLGPNLVKNGGFEDWDRKQPQDWLVSNTSRNPKFNVAVFVGGIDKLQAWSTISARSNGLWVQNLLDKQRVFYGYQQHNIHLEASTYYLVSFYFRTANLSDKDIVRSSLATVSPSSFKSAALWLPSTGMRWRKYIMLVSNDQLAPLTTRKLIFLYGAGSVWVDQVDVKSMKFEQDVTTLSHQVFTEPITVIR